MNRIICPVKANGRQLFSSRYAGTQRCRPGSQGRPAESVHPRELAVAGNSYEAAAPHIYVLLTAPGNFCSCRRQGLPGLPWWCHPYVVLVARCPAGTPRCCMELEDALGRSAADRMTGDPGWFGAGGRGVSLESSSGPGFGRRSGPRDVGRSPSVRSGRRGAARCSFPACPCPVRRHAEWRGRSRRTRTLPPICGDIGCLPVRTLTVRIWIFCASEGCGPDVLRMPLSGHPPA